MTFDYVNESGRPTGRFLKTLGVVLPGVARVQADVPRFAAAWRADNLAALAAGPAGGPLWVALGDSLTLGVGAPQHDRGWVGQVRGRLAATGHPHRVVNLAVSGATVRDLVERQLPVLEDFDADLVTVMIGSNDLTRPSDRRKLVERFETMLRRLPAGAVVTTLPNPTRVAARVNEALGRIGPRRRLVPVELRDPRTASWRGRLAADHFHPNEQGYRAIADVVGDVVLRAARARDGDNADD